MGNWFEGVDEFFARGGTRASPNPSSFVPSAIAVQETNAQRSFSKVFPVFSSQARRTVWRNPPTANGAFRMLARDCSGACCNTEAIVSLNTTGACTLRMRKIRKRIENPTTAVTPRAASRAVR